MLHARSTAESEGLYAISESPAWWVATHQVLWFSLELLNQQFIIINFIIMAHNINCIIILLTSSGENHKKLMYQVQGTQESLFAYRRAGKFDGDLNLTVWWSRG